MRLLDIVLHCVIGSLQFPQYSLLVSKEETLSFSDSRGGCPPPLESVHILISDNMHTRFHQGKKSI